MSFNFNDFLNVLDGEIFEEKPVSIEEFCTSEDYLNLPPLSEHQYNLIKASTQIYKRETLHNLLGVDEGEKRWRQTCTEVVLQLGKGCNIKTDEVYDADTGQWKTFEELTRSPEGYSAGLNGNKIDSEFRTEAFSKGTETVYEVTTAQGIKTTVSAEHTFYAKKKWQDDPEFTPLRELGPGSYIARAAGLPINNPVPLDDREVRLLGYWIGDGMMPTDVNPTLNVDFNSYETQAIQEYIYICESYGDSPIVTKHVSKNMVFIRHHRDTPLYDIVRKHGLWGKRAHDKEIPGAIFSLPDNQLALFISRLHGTDGCIYIKNNKTACPVIEYRSISERLVIGYQKLLARLGIAASVRSRYPKYTYKGETRVGQKAYYLSISDAEGFRRFGRAICLLDKQPFLDRGMEIAGRVSNKWSRYDNDIFWDRIKSIKEVGSEEVFTITATDTHNFVANLVLNGNSGK